VTHITQVDSKLQNGPGQILIPFLAQNLKELL